MKKSSQTFLINSLCSETLFIVFTYSRYASYLTVMMQYKHVKPNQTYLLSSQNISDWHKWCLRSTNLCFTIKKTCFTEISLKYHDSVITYHFENLNYSVQVWSITLKILSWYCWLLLMKRQEREDWVGYKRTAFCRADFIYGTPSIRNHQANCN